MTTPTPTGVFVRLPLTAEHLNKFQHYRNGGCKPDVVMRGIGTPVTGGDMQPIAFVNAERLKWKISTHRDVCLTFSAKPHLGGGTFDLIDGIVLHADHLAALASLQAEIKRLKDEAEQSRRKNFNAGYLLACCNIVNLHNEEGIAADILCELGITEDEVKALDLTEYDAKALTEIRKARGTDPIVKGPEA